MTAVSMAADDSARIDGLRRPVADLRRSIDFYCGALGFTALRSGGPTRAGGVRLRLGEQHIDLFVPKAPASTPTPVAAPDPRFQHAAIVAGDMDAAWRRLASYGVVAISRGGPQRLPAHTGGVTAWKFRDPDGHPLELLAFPPGAGDPRWQAAAGVSATLGIDHFALVVADIERSVAFFAAALGLQVSGRELNCGAEQDRLDGLDGVEVDVVALAPPHGSGTPHLELLRYRRTNSVGAAGGTPAAIRVERDEIVCRNEKRRPSGSEERRFVDPDGHGFRVEADAPRRPHGARLD